MSNYVVKVWLTLGLLGLALSSQAALFDDKEARKKILDVEATSLATDEAHQAAINDLRKAQANIERRLVAIESVIQGGGLVELQNQIGILRQEVAQLRGDLEVVNHQIESTQQRQKDLYTDTDMRLRKVETLAVAPSSANDAVTHQMASEEKDAKVLAEANALSQSGKHKEAFNAYDAFLKEFAGSKLVPDALYGMGYSQFALKNYKSSIVTQLKLIDAYPNSERAPEAMFNMANSQIQLGQVANAKKSLRDLIAQYPNAEIIPTAEKRLKALEALK